MKINVTTILRITLGLVLVVLAWYSALTMIPPKAVGKDVSATRFSAGRAMNDLEIVASKPHSTGSPAQEAVREYIISQINLLGLKAEIQGSGGISNILVHLPGTDPTQAVLVTCHYDSALSTPGAGDDGISTVAMLETIRVLQASPSLRNDIIFLFTDGEELGWVGAKSFINEYPDAQQKTGVVLVFDARPGNAPLVMSETTPGDGWLIRQMTGIPLRVWAGSWNNREERSEMNTDFDVFAPAGFTGVVFENETNGTRYHTDRDTVDAISPDLVQAYGQTMLALINRFGSLDLNTATSAPDLLYFNVPLVGLVAYPLWAMLVLSSLSILAVIACIGYAWRIKRFTFRNFLLGVGGLVVGILLSIIIGQLVWSVVLKTHAHEVAAYGRFEASAGWQIGLMIASALLMIVIQFFLIRKLGIINIAAAGIAFYLVIWLVVYFALDSDNPLTTPSIALPFLGSVIGMGVLLFLKNPVLKLILLSFCAFIMLVLIIPNLWIGSYTAEDAWIPILVTSITLCLFIPLIDAPFGNALTIQEISNIQGK